MDKTTMKQVGIGSIGVTALIGVVFSLYQYGGGSLRSNSLNEIVTPSVCYLQPEIDKKFAEKAILESADKTTAQSIQDALSKIDPAILGETILIAEKAKIDKLGQTAMTETKPSDTVYLEAKKTLDSLPKPVIPVEPNVPAVPVLSPAPTVPTAPKVPAIPVVPAVPVIPVEPRVPAVPVLSPAPTVPTVPKVHAIPFVPAVPVIPVEPRVPAVPVLSPAPTVPTVPKKGTAAYTTYINVTKPAYDNAKKIFDTVTKPAYTKALGEYNTAVAAKKTYDTKTKPDYDARKKKYDDALGAKKVYDTVTKPAYDAFKRAYDDAVAAKKVYDTVTKPAYTKALGEYNTAVAAKKTYDTKTKPAYDALKKKYDDALGAKKVYDTVTKPAYDAFKRAYDDAVAAKKVYDTVTKPAYTEAKKAYDTVTKPTYDALKKKYDDALGAKKVYDNTEHTYTELLNEYNKNVILYDAYLKYKSGLEEYTYSIMSLLRKSIVIMKNNLCPTSEAMCANNIDDDRDNTTDCSDNDCANDVACRKTCANGASDYPACTNTTSCQKNFHMENDICTPDCAVEFSAGEEGNMDLSFTDKSSENRLNSASEIRISFMKDSEDILGKYTLDGQTYSCTPKTVPDKDRGLYSSDNRSCLSEKKGTIIECTNNWTLQFECDEQDNVSYVAKKC